MRTTELWEVTCVCGADVSSPTPDFVCRTCGRHGRVERPDCGMALDLTDRTISEREGAK